MMKRIHFIAGLCALLSGCSPKPPARPDGVPARIISFSPGITETVYALGLGHKIVGATAYCLYPEDAKTLPRIGGFGQYNYEAIVSLHPDLVLLDHNQTDEQRRLDGLGIPCIRVKTGLMNDILDSIRIIGEACGAEKEAQTLLDRMQRQIAAVQPPPGTPPRVLITFGSEAVQIDRIHAFGADCLHSELLELAGGINVVEQHLPFSTLSKEAVIRLNPDMIIQLAPGAEAPADLSAPWKDYPSVEAVKNNRIYLLTGDYTCIPGPRFVRILNDFNSITHP